MQICKNLITHKAFPLYAKEAKTLRCAKSSMINNDKQWFCRLIWLQTKLSFILIVKCRLSNINFFKFSPKCSYKRVQSIECNVELFAEKKRYVVVSLFSGKNKTKRKERKGERLINIEKRSYSEKHKRAARQIHLRGISHKFSWKFKRREGGKCGSIFQGLQVHVN